MKTGWSHTMSVYTPARLPWKSGTVVMVTVTLDHLLRGRPCSSNECALAIATEEHFAALFPGTRWAATVDDFSVAVYECDGTDQWCYSHDARPFMEDYDDPPHRGADPWPAWSLWAQSTVEPFVLELRT